MVFVRKTVSHMLCVASHVIPGTILNAYTLISMIQNYKMKIGFVQNERKWISRIYQRRLASKKKNQVAVKQFNIHLMILTSVLLSDIAKHR